MYFKFEINFIWKHLQYKYAIHDNGTIVVLLKSKQQQQWWEVQHQHNTYKHFKDSYRDYITLSLVGPSCTIIITNIRMTARCDMHL